MGAHGFALLKREINGSFFVEKLIQGVLDPRDFIFDTRMLNSEHETFRHFSVYFEAKSYFDREFEKGAPHRPFTYLSNN